MTIKDLDLNLATDEDSTQKLAVRTQLTACSLGFVSSQNHMFSTMKNTKNDNQRFKPKFSN